MHTHTRDQFSDLMVRQQLHIYCFSANNAMNASTNITMSNVKNSPADQPIDQISETTE